MDCNEWKGPGVVIGRKGVVIFVRYGGTYVRVHHCRLRKAKDHYTDESGDSQESQTELNAAECDMDNVFDLPNTVSGDVDSVSDTENAAERPNNDNNDKDPSDRQPPIIRKDCCMNLKAGQSIKYVERDTGISHTAKVLGRAGKVTGKNKDRYNLEYTEPGNLTGTTGSADLSQVDTLQIESRDRVEQPSDRHHEDVLVTKDVLFEELNTKDLPKDSPTCALESLRLLMSVICQNQWTPHSMDIKSAFLQGNELSWDISVRPPPEAKRQGTSSEKKNSTDTVGTYRRAAS